MQRRKAILNGILCGVIFITIFLALPIWLMGPGFLEFIAIYFGAVVIFSCGAGALVSVSFAAARAISCISPSKLNEEIIAVGIIVTVIAVVGWSLSLDYDIGLSAPWRWFF